jgi:hypothetical protein
VHALRSYDYAVIRVVPRVERQEFVNAGVLLWSKEQDFLAARERFDWLVAPRSTIIQTSSVHTGRCEDLPATLEHLLNVMVRKIPPPRSP